MDHRTQHSFQRLSWHSDHASELWRFRNLLSNLRPGTLHPDMAHTSKHLRQEPSVHLPWIIEITVGGALR
jgi:hypothetical protein